MLVSLQDQANCTGGLSGEDLSPQVMSSLSLSLTSWAGLEKVVDPLILGNLALCGLKCLEMEECGALHYDKNTQSCSLAKVRELGILHLVVAKLRDFIVDIILRQSQVFGTKMDKYKYI